jgi:hypothetical protein
MGSPFPLLLAIARRHRPGGTASPLGRRQSPFLNLITLCTACHTIAHHPGNKTHWPRARGVIWFRNNNDSAVETL